MTRKNRVSKIVLLMAFLLSCAFHALAQTDEHTRVEVFGGYSVLGANYKIETPNPPMPVITAFDGKQTFHGFNGSVTGYFTKGFGITGDFSAHFKKNTTPDPLGTIETNTRVLNFLAGPQYKFRNSSRLSPFVRALAGVAVTSSTLDVPSLNSSFTSSSTDFALALGGGVDLRLSKHFDLRLIQADYNPVFLKSGNELGFSNTANNFRFSFGGVFRY